MRQPGVLRTAIACASAIYLVTLVLVPFLAPERDVLRSYPEDYADGAPGALVRLGYAAVAMAAGAVAIATWPRRPGWRYLPPILALCGAALSLVLAAAPQQVSGGVLLAGVIALALTPAAVSVADGARLHRAVRAFGVAVTLSFVAFAIAPKDAAGIVNRIWDVALALWFAAYAIARRRA